MVMFPNSLTEEEEALQKKYAKLKKKVGAFTRIMIRFFVKGMLIKHRTVQQYLSVVAGKSSAENRFNDNQLLCAELKSLSTSASLLKQHPIWYVGQSHILEIYRNYKW